MLPERTDERDLLFDQPELGQGAPRIVADGCLGVSRWVRLPGTAYAYRMTESSLSVSGLREISPP